MAALSGIFPKYENQKTFLNKSTIVLKVVEHIVDIWVYNVDSDVYIVDIWVFLLFPLKEEVLPKVSFKVLFWETCTRNYLVALPAVF